MVTLDSCSSVFSEVNINVQTSEETFTADGETFNSSDDGNDRGIHSLSNSMLNNELDTNHITSTHSNLIAPVISNGNELDTMKRGDDNDDDDNDIKHGDNDEIHDLQSRISRGFCEPDVDENETKVGLIDNVPIVDALIDKKTKLLHSKILIQIKLIGKQRELYPKQEMMVAK